MSSFATMQRSMIERIHLGVHAHYTALPKPDPGSQVAEDRRRSS
jgi:hypothetical protein